MKNMFLELEAEFKKIKTEFSNLLAKTQEKSQKTIITKGKMFNVLPFENELIGYKLNGKEIAEPVFKNDCYKYHFDEQNRVILVEEMSENTKKFYYRTFYHYGENFIQTQRWGYDELYNVTHYLFENEKVTKKLFFTEEDKSFWDYQYSDNQLISIKVSYLDKNFEPIPNVDLFQFYYEKNSNILQSIIRKDITTNGSECVYTTKKVNFKQLEIQITDWIRQNIAKFSKENPSEKVCILGILCYAGFGKVDMTLEVDNQEFYDTPADWKYNDWASMDLPDIPFDDKDSEKLQVLVAQILNELTATEIFQNLNKTADFAITIFDHDAEHIHTENTKIKKILKENPFFKK